jgi:hypothetical protein
MSSEMVDAMEGEMELMAEKIEQSEMALLEARARVVILEDAAASLEEALERIVSWSKAYLRQVAVDFKAHSQLGIRAIEGRMENLTELLASTGEQPEDRRAWDHLLAHCPVGVLEDALERRNYELARDLSRGDE